MSYYIIKHAVYIHGVYGPYSSENAALKAFHKAYEATDTNVLPYYNDFDGHHDYTLVKGFPKKVGENLCDELGDIKGITLSYVSKKGDKQQ